jgi:DNA-binding NarL/FixJ family response regulator
MLTMHGKKDYLDQAMSNGADGFILKGNMDQELDSTIRAVRCGKVYLSPLP